MFIVPNYVRDALQAAIDKALDGRPIEADEREHVYCMILEYYSEHGVIPDFSLNPSPADAAVAKG